MYGPCDGRRSSPSSRSSNQRASARRAGARSTRTSSGCAAGAASMRSCLASAGERDIGAGYSTALAGVASARLASRAPVACDGGVVLLYGPREVVVTLVFGDEVEIPDGRRVQRGLYRGQAGARDRPRWQTRVAVGVERVLHDEVGAGRRAPLLAHGVLHGRVRLERHVEPEPVPA